MVRKMIGAVMVVGIFLGGVLFGTWAHASYAAVQPDALMGNGTHFHYGDRHAAGKAAVSLGLIKATADVTGITVTEVVQSLRDGQTLTEIAEAHGKSSDEVLQAFTNLATVHIDTAVQEGKLTRQQADFLLQRVTNQATQMMADEMLGEQVVKYLERGVLVVLGRATVDVTGLEPVVVLQRFRGGETLAEIAASEGKSSDEVLQAAEVIFTNRMNTAVANGRITQEEADVRLAEFTSMAERLINEPAPDNAGQQRSGLNQQQPAD